MKSWSNNSYFSYVYMDNIFQKSVVPNSVNTINMYLTMNNFNHPIQYDYNVPA